MIAPGWIKIPSYEAAHYVADDGDTSKCGIRVHAILYGGVRSANSKDRRCANCARRMTTSPTPKGQDSRKDPTP